MKLLEALQGGVLLGDGANGTCLAERGFTKQPYDLANLQAPDLVRQVHAEYFSAGSDFVETNTFQANRIRMTDLNVDVVALNIAGARLAREAAVSSPPTPSPARNHAGEGGRFVLGAIGPCGKPMEPIGNITVEEVRESVREQAAALAEGGVDGFMLETFIDLNELKVAVEAIREISDLPIIVSKAFIEDGEALAEGLPSRCARIMSEMGVVAVGANCVVGPQRMLDLVRQMREETSLPIMAFPTPGFPQLVKGHISYDTSPDYFAKAVARLVEEGASIVGGCCGTTPEHIRQLRALLDRGHIKPRAHAATVRSTIEKKPLPLSQPSELSQKLGRKFVTTVEMDVPRGLNVEKLLNGARSLKIAGADCINISDGARARLRMNPAAVSHLIQSKVGIEVVMHFSCRDRNLLAIQSDLLGWHALGIRNILAVTGDPPNIGDYPSATSVFDVDAIGLCRILARFNEGIDLAGYTVGVKCGFTIACAYNPVAIDQALEDDRLRRKVDAGTNVVYTQPVFDSGLAERTAAFCASLGVPVFVGVLPLRSQRHAEFMHNEVPGIDIPGWLRARMAGAGDDAEALEIGIEEAQKLSCDIKRCAQGLYLMPPFGSAEVAVKVLSSVLGG